MGFLETFLKYHNEKINWKCPICGQTMSAVVERCVRKCTASTRPFSITEVKTKKYFDGVEEKWKDLN